MNPIPYGRQYISDEDIAEVVDTLRSDYLTQGPKIKEFEEAFASYVGAKYAVALSNGTAALHLAVMAMGVKPGDKVITTPITFAASANCVRYCGGEVVFGDIDPDTYLLSVDAVRSLVESAPRGTYSGIIPVDFAGRAVDMEAFRLLADEHNLWLIEDACHAPGGYFVDAQGDRQFCGNGNFAELAVFSFHPVKHIACGEGGMVTTNDEQLYRTLLQLRTHGITREKDEFENSPSFASGEPSDTFPAWYMEMQTLGYNYRLSDFQAALGTSQLKRAAEGLERRRQIAAAYEKAFQGQSFIKGQSGVVEGHAYHLYVIETDDRLGLYNYLRSKQIFAQIHYVPCHLMPYYRAMGWHEGQRPFSEAYYQKCLSLPMYPTLSDAELEYVTSTILAYFNG